MSLNLASVFGYQTAGYVAPPTVRDTAPAPTKRPSYRGQRDTASPAAGPALPIDAAFRRPRAPGPPRRSPGKCPEGSTVFALKHAHLPRIIHIGTTFREITAPHLEYQQGLLDIHCSRSRLPHGLRTEIHLRKETSKAHHAGKARWACLFTSAHSLDPDADAVTKVPGDGFGPDVLERGLSEAIETDLLIGELELVAERTALHHLQKPCRVSLLDRMQ
jgi:hypothetical protein